MQLPADVAELLLDGRVHVLASGLPLDVVEQPQRLVQLLVREQPRGVQPLCVHAGRLDVVRK